VNRLYYGDNLDVLRRHVEDASVDLVYLDPPFNSNASYNVLFAERDGAQAASQIKAFEDTWKWDEGAARACNEVIEAGGKVSEAMQAFRTFLGDSDMMAYLAMMAPRLVELRRVLKATGSVYLHCDPTASHYLKMLLDAVFGAECFLNEIIWKRTAAHSAAKRWNVVHDVLLFYARSDAHLWNDIQIEHSEEYEARFKRHDDDGRSWTDDNLTGPGIRHGDSGATWRGYDPTARGAHWKVSTSTVVALVGKEQAARLTTTEKLDVLDKHRFILWPKKSQNEGGGFPRFKRYLSGGRSIQDVIADIPPINSQAQERLGYPTQKPEALLERIIAASSNEGDVVLDPFCGCGTAVAAAQKLSRRWIGIDITSLAISLIRHRLADAFGDQAKYEVVGEPVSLPDAVKLAHDDPYQFQWWALGLVGARPVEQKKGADEGIDGRIYFHEGDTTKTKQIILSVKAGHVTVAHVRDLRGVLDREKAEIGVLLCMDEPTAPMRKEAANVGFYKSPWGQHPRLQILTVEDLLTGKTIDRPPAQTSVTFKRAPKAAPKVRETAPMPFGEPDDSN
jgi:DNA modification methylase